MPHPDSDKYKFKLDGQLPHFTDHGDARFGYGMGGPTYKMGILYYYQWLHCCGNWGEEHSMCQKMRYYTVVNMTHNALEKWDERKKLGFFDYTLLYGAKPWKDFQPLYQPVKKYRKGAYEFWLDRKNAGLGPLWDEGAADWREKAPALGEMFIFGKKVKKDE